MNKLYLSDPVCAVRRNDDTHNTVEHFIVFVSLTVENIVIRLMIHMLKLICRNIKKNCTMTCLVELRFL